MRTQNAVQFFDHMGNPIYQPLITCGFIYHRGGGRRPYWTATIGAKHFTSQQVAQHVGLAIRSLIVWENAVDDEQEATDRADFN